MDPISTLALAMGASWASGLNLYAAILTLGGMQHLGMMQLPPDMMIVANPLVLGAAAIMYMVEFVADKIPGVDSGWDAIHTFIRIPAGAILAAQAVGDVDPALSVAAGLMGGTLAAGSHLTKASARLAINTSPEPFSNWAASVAEDVAVFGGLAWMSSHPYWFLGALVCFIALMIWLLPKLWRVLGRIFAKLRTMLGGEPRAAPAPAMAAAAAGPSGTMAPPMAPPGLPAVPRGG